MPFTVEMLLDYFALYNQRIWPLQILGFAAGLLALVPLFWRSKTSDRVLTAVLAFLWLWIGLVFWMQAASQMALLYGPTLLFSIQGLLLLHALLRDRMAYGDAGPLRTAVALIILTYALVGYPLVGLVVGHQYPHAALSPLFPCPAAMLTLGAFVLARKAPLHLLIIPVFWGLSGSLWFYLGMVEDAGLVIAALAVVAMLIARLRASQRTVGAASHT